MHIGAQHLQGELIAGDGVGGLREILRQAFDAGRGNFRVAVVVHIFPVGFSRVETLFDALQAGRQHQRGAEIRVAGDVRRAAFHARAGTRNAQHVGAVVVAVAAEHRRPGGARHAALAHQALVTVNRGRNHGADRLGMAQHAADELIGKLRYATGVAVFPGAGGEQVLAGIEACQRHIVMRAAAGAVGEGFGHEAGEGAVLAGHLVCQQTEIHQAIRHGQRIRVVEIDFKLAVGIFVVEGIHPPAHDVECFHQRIDDGDVVEHCRHVVAGLAEGVARAERFGAALRCFAQNKEFRLDTEIETEAHVRRSGQLALEDIARAGGKGFAVQVQITGEPGDIGVPLALLHGRGIRHGGHFVVGDILRHAIQRGAGEQFGAGEHLLEMRHGHELALAGAVNIHIAGDAVLDAALQTLLL